VIVSSRISSARWLAAMVGAAIACGVACESKTNTAGGPAAPLGAGYDDLRVLSRDDCMALRDHQIEIAVNDALIESDAWTPDAAQRLVLEADLRLHEKPATDAWIQRCTGRTVPAVDLRCMREATTTTAFNACGTMDDAGTDEVGDAASTGEET
jgi:hypothetical protein